jgi:hypothetical protein
VGYDFIMCFMLYVGTMKPIPRSSWRREAPAVYVQSLIEYDEAIRAHFSSPEVQKVGSTSGCGCDFPHLMYQNGGWPEYLEDETDAERLASDQLNRESLAELVRSTGESAIELYGVWAGDFAEEPKIRENISLEDIQREVFFFKERGFYCVGIQRGTD